jgi:hypothetical protein
MLPTHRSLPLLLACLVLADTFAEWTLWFAFGSFLVESNIID